MKKKNSKSKKYLILYIILIGGFAIAAIVFFNIAQFAKAQYTAANTVLMTAESNINAILAADPNAYLETSPSYDKYIWFIDIKEHFDEVASTTYQRYKNTCLPAYGFSLLTLIAFGIVLKINDAIKEKEDKDVAD